MFKVLVVEDDSDINNLLCNMLSKNNYDVRGAYSGSEAIMCIEMFEYDIILLDLMLPGMTGEGIIEKVREKDELVPIIVISAKTEQNDKINVLRMGADDFVSKPFDINEVLVRVEVQLRKSKREKVAAESVANIVSFKNINLDVESRQAFIKEKEITLTGREFDILKLFISNPHKVFTRANLFESVWDNEFLGDENTVNVHVSNLRAKIAKVETGTEYIKTVWGIGFKLNES
ncbi:MAG: response regulator transcription factor [Sarcina sp.]